MKRILIPLTAIFVLAAAALSGYLWWKENSKAPSSNSEKVRLVIPKGRSASQIGEMLKKEDLITNPLAFKIYLQINDKAGSIQSGEYSLSQNLTLSEVVSELLKGPSQLWVTIPEGLRKEEVVEKIIVGLEMDLNEAKIFRSDFLKNPEAVEGYLFPDTYLFPRDVTAALVVKRMRSVFDGQISSEMRDAISKSGYDLSDIVVLASMIERETKTDAERPIVAGILYNRLEIGMALQIDATVQYAVASTSCPYSETSKSHAVECENWWPILTREDLEINSAYNTYKNRDLIPGAIANPGLTSLEAAVSPESSDYLFYIHDSQGKIHYAETLDGHNQNIRNYLGK